LGVCRAVAGGVPIVVFADDTFVDARVCGIEGRVLRRRADGRDGDAHDEARAGG
jgi:hypothetical protein